MSNIVLLDAGPKAPSDLSRQLRDIADAVDRGEVTGLVAGYFSGNEFEFLYGASIRGCLELATILQYRCIRKYET
jgi:hypothetical protein